MSLFDAMQPNAEDSQRAAHFLRLMEIHRDKPANERLQLIAANIALLRNDYTRVIDDLSARYQVERVDLSATRLDLASAKANLESRDSQIDKLLEELEDFRAAKKFRCPA